MSSLRGQTAQLSVVSERPRFANLSTNASLLSTGTPLLYVILKQEPGIRVASVRFSSSVVCLSTSVYPGHRGAVCILGVSSGAVLYLNTDRVLQSLTSSADDEQAPAAKRPKKDLDIFASLLSDTQPDELIQDDLSFTDSLDGASCSTTLISISPDLPLSVILHKSLLIILKRRKSGCTTLVIRKIRERHGSCPFSIDPSVVMEVTCNEGIGLSLPAFIPALVAQSDLSSLSSSSCQLPADFFSAVFSRGVSLSNNSALFYASPVSGTVHACDLKCPAGYFSEFCGQVRNSSHQVLYLMGQPVVNIHTFKSRPDGGTDSLLFVGAKGKFVLCSPASNNRHGLGFQEFYLHGPILSSLLVDDFGLLFSTTDKISLICLKPQCLSKPDTQATSLSLLEAFYSPVTILNSPLYLLSSSRPNDNHNLTVLGLTMSGKLLEFFVSTSLNAYSKETTSAAQVGEDMALACRKIEASSAQLKHIQEETSETDRLIEEFGRDLSLLCSVLSHSTSCLFLCEVSGCSEQISLSESRASIAVNLTYSGSTPLSSNWALLIQTIPTNSRHSLTLSSTLPTTISSSISLTGLTLQQPITVKQLLSPNLHTPLSVRCLLYYCPSLPEALSIKCGSNSVAVPIKTSTLTSIDFLRPQSVASTTITIGEDSRLAHSTPVSALSGYVHVSSIIINSQYIQTLYLHEGDFDAVKLMRSVLFRNLHPQTNSLVSSITASGLDNSSELKAISYNGTSVVFKMQTCQSENGPQAELTIRTTSQPLMVQLCEAIHQNLQKSFETRYNFETRQQLKCLLSSLTDLQSSLASTGTTPSSDQLLETATTILVDYINLCQ